MMSSTIFYMSNLQRKDYHRLREKNVKSMFRPTHANVNVSIYSCEFKVRVSIWSKVLFCCWVLPACTHAILNPVVVRISRDFSADGSETDCQRCWKAGEAPLPPWQSPLLVKDINRRHTSNHFFLKCILVDTNFIKSHFWQFKLPSG